jgi:hypothetical protein
VLVVAWLLAALRPRGPYPIIALSGEQGSAKSTFTRMLKALIDPNTSPLRALPREDRDMFITATEFKLPLSLGELAGSSIRAGISLDLGTPAKALLDFLDRIIAILQASVGWCVKQAGAVASAVSGLAESVQGLLGKLVQELSTAAQEVYKELIIEVRLDPRDYHLRQVLLTPKKFRHAGDADFKKDFAGFEIRAESLFKPALILDFADEWFGIALLNQGLQAKVSIGTDLWLKRETTPAQPMKGLNRDTGSGANKEGRLLQLTVQAKGDVAFVPIAFPRGRIKLFHLGYAHEEHPAR